MSATAIRDMRQTTLPQEVAEAAGLKPGDQVDWRFEGGEIRGRKLESAEPVVLGLNDVAKGGILPAGWKFDPADIANAMREERDDT
jgi:bifunctional DNA-binding transcriptional regulator/antitoxin component of YhaV-PrlF toxin-antitoxin module